MNKELIAKIREVAEPLEWSVKDEGDRVRLSKYSPAGGDFSRSIYVGEDSDNIHDFIYNLREEYTNFDVSEETYVWLDNTGHGINGAPYDMKDVYEDVEACEEYILELLQAFEESVKYDDFFDDTEDTRNNKKITVGDKVCINLAPLYRRYGEELTYCVIENTVLDEEKPDILYLDLWDGFGNKVCMDGEECAITGVDKDTVYLINPEGENDICFWLTKEEFGVVAFNSKG